jgi:ABC-type transporter Mla subunit MlaD
LAESNTLNNFSGSLNGLVGDLGSNVSKLTSSLDITGKAAKFASQFGDPLASLKNLSNFNVTSLVNTGNLTRSLANAGNTISGGLSSLTSGLPNFSGLVNLAGLGSLGSLGGIFGGGGDELVSSTQVAAGYSNTVNRGTLDVALLKIIGSPKVPLPVFDSSSPGSISLNANKDILAASNILQGLRGLGGTVLTQANQITNSVNSVAGQAGGVISNALNRFV